MDELGDLRGEEASIVLLVDPERVSEHASIVGLYAWSQTRSVSGRPIGMIHETVDPVRRAGGWSTHFRVLQRGYFAARASTTSPLLNRAVAQSEKWV